MKLWDNFGVVGGYEVIAILDNIGQKKEEKKEQATNNQIRNLCLANIPTSQLHHHAENSCIYKVPVTSIIAIPIPIFIANLLIIRPANRLIKILFYLTITIQFRPSPGQDLRAEKWHRPRPLRKAYLPMMTTSAVYEREFSLSDLL